MLNFERNNKKDAKFHDVQFMPASSTGECEAEVCSGGFTPGGDIGYEEADDEDGSIGAPPSASWSAGGGAILTSQSEAPKEVWSSENHMGSGIGFLCKCDIMKGVLFAKLALKESDMENKERALKVAVTKLFDIAEARRFRRITIGLAPEHMGNPEFVCSLLYLGFQVIPARKTPFMNIGLMLDFNTGYTLDDAFTGTSECSTSAEDDDDHEVESDLSLENF